VATLRASESASALRSLISALAGREGAHAEALRRLLAERRDPEAIAHLVVRLAETEPEESLRWQEELRRLERPALIRDVAEELGGMRSERGRALLEEAAEQGDPDALVALVVELAETSPEQSERWQARLVRASPSQYLMRAGHGLGGLRSARGRALFEAAAEQGDTDALVALVAGLAKTAPEESQRWQEELIRRGHPYDIYVAARKLGGVRSEPGRALLEALARQGDVDAMVDLVVELAQHSPEESERWEQELVNRGSPEAIRRVAERFGGTESERGRKLQELSQSLDDGQP
jgi:hypothetical protein